MCFATRASNKEGGVESERRERVREGETKREWARIRDVGTHTVHSYMVHLFPALRYVWLPSGLARQREKSQGKREASNTHKHINK